MKRLALQLKDESSLLIFGRGVNYATALEAALKVGIRPLYIGTFLWTLASANSLACDQHFSEYLYLKCSLFFSALCCAFVFCKVK